MGPHLYRSCGIPELRQYECCRRTQAIVRLAGPPPYRRPLLAAEWRTDVVDLFIATVPGVPTAARRALAGNGVVCLGGHGAQASW